MKCLLCNLQFETIITIDELKYRYITFHKVDPNNHFFKKHFHQSKNKVICQKCFRCNEFFTTKNHKKVHNFLKHYPDGKTKPFEDKPTEIKEIGDLKSYEISYNKHCESYDFSNADELVDEFLKNVKVRFKSSGNVIIKCGFTIESIQPAPTDFEVPLLTVRYWSTEPYKTIYLNIFFFSLKEGILKRVIRNGMTGSWWRFNKFIYLNLKFLKEKYNFVR